MSIKVRSTIIREAAGDCVVAVGGVLGKSGKYSQMEDSVACRRIAFK